MAEETNVQEEALADDNPQSDDTGTTEEESGEESEVETGEDISSDDGEDGERDTEEEESRNSRKDRAKAQIERLKEENKRLKEEKRKLERTGKATQSTDIMAKAFLASTYDIKESDAQDEAIRLADKFDMSIDELMEDPDYRDKISSIQKRIVNQRKVSANTGGASQRKKDASYVADYFKKNQTFPEGTSLELRNEAINLVTGKPRQPWQR